MMSRKVGLSDTYFDPDIDGEVDFDFFGGSYEEECDPKTADERQKPVAGPQLNNKSIQALKDNESNDPYVTNNILESKSDNSEFPISLIAEGANLCSDASVKGRVGSSGGDGISMKPWVMRPEAKKLLKQKSVSQSTDDDFSQVSHDDVYSTSADTQIAANADMISPSCQTQCELVDDRVDEMSSTGESSTVFNMKLLSRAITDLKMQDKHYQGSLNGQDRSIARSERSLPVSRPRKNMTFNNEEVRKIDLENKILLRKIIQAHNPSRKCPRRTAPPTVIASSTINRMREFKKIESENLLFLKRLHAVKPTKSLRLNERSKSSFVRNDNAKSRINSSSSSWIGTGSESIDSANLTSRASSSTSSIKLPNIKNR